MPHNSSCSHCHCYLWRIYFVYCLPQFQKLACPFATSKLIDQQLVQQDRQYTYHITMWHIRITTVAMETQQCVLLSTTADSQNT